MGLAGFRGALVEDEIAKAVKYWYRVGWTDWLYHMWVMAHDGIGPGSDEGTGLAYLLWCGKGLELHSPVEHADDVVGRVPGAVGTDGLGQLGSVRLTWGCFGGITRPVFQRKEHGAEEGGGDGAFLYKGGGQTLFGIVAPAHGRDARPAEGRYGGTYALVALVVGVVVGQRGMGDAGLPHDGGGAGVGPENELFAQRCGHLGERAFEVDHGGVCRVEERVHPGEEPCPSVALPYCPHAAVKQDIAREEDDQRVSLFTGCVL